jgi:hypothetical protein
VNHRRQHQNHENIPGPNSFLNQPGADSKSSPLCQKSSLESSDRAVPGSAPFSAGPEDAAARAAGRQARGEASRSTNKRPLRHSCLHGPRMRFLQPAAQTPGCFTPPRQFLENALAMTNSSFGEELPEHLHTMKEKPSLDKTFDRRPPCLEACNDGRLSYRAPSAGMLPPASRLQPALVPDQLGNRSQQDFLTGEGTSML